MGQGSFPSFGPLLRHYRVAMGLTQEALAERAGLSARVISEIERGGSHRPRKDTVALLADALALSVAERTAFGAAAQGSHRAGAGDTAGAGSAKSTPPLVGRTRELGLLERHLEGDDPPLLLLAGEPGIGKSRLLGEAGRLASAGGWRVLRGGCRQSGGQEPYAPVLGALQRHLLGLSSTEERGALAGCAWLVRLLPELANSPIERLPTWTVPPAQERRLTFDAVTRFLGNAAGPAGTLLLLDDLHWAGSDALDLLRVVVHSAADGRLRVVGAYRDSEVDAEHPLALLLADFAAAGLAARRVLAPLPETEAASLLAALIPETEPARRQQMVKRTGGLPFFLVSCAQAAQAGTQDEGAKDDGIPWSVAQTVRQRVALLPPAAREVLAVAAVAGREVRRDVLAAVVLQSPRSLLATLDEICRARLLDEVDGAAYRFVHDLIREVIEDDLSAGRRAVLHQDLARALEGQVSPAPVEQIAYHYAQTEEHALAALWLERAGDDAAGRFATVTALAHYRAARPHLEAAGLPPEQLSLLAEKTGDLCSKVGHHHKALEEFGRALAATTEPARRAELRCKQAPIWGTTLNEGERAIAALSAAECEGMATGVVLPARVRATIALAWGHLSSWRDDHVAAEAATERALHILEEEPSSAARDSLLLQIYDLQGHLAMGPAWDLARARDRFERCLALAESLDDRHALAHAQILLGRVRLGQQVELDRAEDYFQQALRFVEAVGNVGSASMCWLGLGLVAKLRRAWVPAEECLQRSIALNEGIGHQGHVAFVSTYLGEILFLRGDLAAADACYRHALAIAEQHEGWGVPWRCLLMLAQIAVARGDLVAAEECAQRALRLAQTPGISASPVIAWYWLAHVACDRGNLSWAARCARQARHTALPAHFEMRLHGVLALARVRSAAGRGRHAAFLLEHVRALLADTGSDAIRLALAMLAADVALVQGARDQAQGEIEQAHQLAQAVGSRCDEALVTVLAARSALAAGQYAEAEAALRAALALQGEMGAALDAARTRLILAAVVRLKGAADDEACALLSAARAQFISSSTALDLIQAEQVAAAWGADRCVQPSSTPAPGTL